MRFYLKLIKYFLLRFRECLALMIKNAFFETKKKLVFRAILRTPPVSISSSGDMQIFTITSASDYLMFVLAIKSLSHFAKRNFDVIVFDDGTLSSKEKNNLKDHLPGIRLISNEELRKKINKSFSRKIELIKSAGKKASPYINKKLGAYLFSTKEKILFLDSDILFFKKPKELLEWIDGKNDFIYIKDIEDSYQISNIESENLFGCALYPEVNSGLLGINKSSLAIPILFKLIQNYKVLSVGREAQFQTFFAIIFAKSKGKKIKPLSKRYLVSENSSDYNQDLVCGHYVRSVREQYFIDVWKVLKTLQRV